MLAWLGLLICLVSASSVHHHEDGIHLFHVCQLCSLEEVTAHGAAIVVSAIPVIDNGVVERDEVLHSLDAITCYYKTDIRGPPAIV